MRKVVIVGFGGLAGFSWFVDDFTVRTKFTHNPVDQQEVASTPLPFGLDWVTMTTDTGPEDPIAGTTGFRKAPLHLAASYYFREVGDT